jgi:hypothetical protein
MGRWLTKVDVASFIEHQNVFNSQIKRGEISRKGILSEHYVVCGCGVEGCGFISLRREDPPPSFEEWVSQNYE